MKRIISILILFSVPCLVTFALENAPICVNRSLKRNVSFDASNSEINLKIKEKVSDVKIESIYGLNGLMVNNYEINELKLNEEFVIKLDLDKPTGQSHIVLQIDYRSQHTPAEVKNREIISVPIGKLSTEQLKERYKNVKIYRDVKKGSTTANESNGASKEIMVRELPVKESNH